MIIRRQSGFTLLEILIAMGILAFVTVFTAQSIQRALQNRTQIQGNLDRDSSMRDALRVLESDVNKAFNHRDINIALYNSMATERNRKIEEAKAKGSVPPGGITQPTQPQPGTTPQAPTSALDYTLLQPMKLKTEVIVTQFAGESDHLDFTSLSNQRISATDRTSDQAKIGYALKECRSRRDRQHSSRCLVRRISPILDKDVSKDGTETVLLEDVTQFELRYLTPASPPEWVASYNTGERGDDKTKGVFPLAVEATIEVQNRDDKKSKPTKMTIVAAIRNPNNPEKKTDATGQTVPGGPVNQ